MIYSVTATNQKNESIVLELTKPEESGLYIQSIEGLGPSKAQINTTELATIDGSIYSSSRMSERNIVLTLGMLYSPTIEAARLRTYKYFPIKKWVKLRFKTDNRLAEVTGYIESNEPNIFSDKETTQISILCPDPYFYEIEGEESIFSGVTPLFEFPYSNESLTANLTEFGDIRIATSAYINYVGDVDTGILLTINALDDASNITIYNTVTNETMKINTGRIVTLTGKAFGEGDSIEINTVHGNRYARLLREGAYTNILSALDKNSDWFQISNGDNLFTFAAESGESALLITFQYRNAYGGI